MHHSHHHHHHRAHAGWEQLFLAAILGCVLLLFLGAAIFATLSLAVRRSETAARNACLPNYYYYYCSYGATQEVRVPHDGQQYDGIFFDQDTYFDSTPPSSPPSRVESSDKLRGHDMEMGLNNNWSPVSSPQQALAASIQQRLAILHTELVS